MPPQDAHERQKRLRKKPKKPSVFDRIASEVEEATTVKEKPVSRAVHEEAKVYGVEQTLTPAELELIKPGKRKLSKAEKELRRMQQAQIKAMGFTTLKLPDPTWQEVSAAASKERRERAKLADAAMMPGSKERTQFIRDTPGWRRKQIEEGRQLPRPRTLTGGQQAAGFLPFPTGHLGGALDIVGKAPGDFWAAVSGGYGAAADYMGAAYWDVTKGLPAQVGGLGSLIGLRNPAGSEAARLAQAAPAGRSVPFERTGRLIKRDVIGLAAAYEAATPEAPEWMPEWMKKEVVRGVVEPESATIDFSHFGEYDPEMEKAGRAAFKHAWTEDPWLTALLAVPLFTAAGRTASVSAISRSLARANPHLSPREIGKLARKESKMPGYAASQGYLGGINPRLIGAKRKITEGEVSDEASFGKPEDLLRYEEKGTPGYSVHKTKGDTHAVWRDGEGRARAYAMVSKEGAVKVYVDPEVQGMRVATELYGVLQRSGVKILDVSGAGPMTSAGAALAQSVGRVPGRRWSRTPHGRAIQRGYDRASDIIEDFLGPNAPRLAQLAATPVRRWRASTRAARITQKRIGKAIQREGAALDRDTIYIGKALKRGEVDEAALFAALQGPRVLAPRRAVEIMIQHLEGIRAGNMLERELINPQDGLTVQIDLLKASLEGTHLESEAFMNGLAALENVSKRADSLQHSVVGTSAWALADRRNLLVREWERLGLLPGDERPPGAGGPLPGPGPLRGRMLELERQLGEVDPDSPEGQQLAADYAEAAEAFTTTEARVTALGKRITDDEVRLAEEWEAGATNQKNYLPEGYRDRESFGRLFREVYDRVIEGWQYGYTWYADSGKTLLDRAGGDVDRADKLAALTAIYSPQRAVSPNFGLAMRAEREWHETKQITLGDENQQLRATAVMKGEDWRALLGPEDAPKVRRFYGNLLKHIDRDRMVARGYDGREVTVDGWIAAAFKYGENTKTAKVNNRQYYMVERIIQQIADDLGIDPEQAQAAMWVSIKASNDRFLRGLPDRADALQRASGSFAQAVDLTTHNVRYAFEAASKQIPEYNTWSPEVQQAFLDANAQAILTALQGQGLYARLTDHGLGLWVNEKGEVEQNPMAALEVSVGSLPSDAYRTLAPGQKEFYDAIAALIGKHLKQDAQGWLRGVVAKTDAEVTHWRMTKEDVTGEQAEALVRELSDIGYVSPTKDGLLFVRYDPDTILDVPEQIAALQERLDKKEITKAEFDAQRRALSSEQRRDSANFKNRVHGAVETVMGVDALDTLEAGGHRGGYLEGLQSYTDAIHSGGRPDLLGRLDRDLSAATSEIRDAFTDNPEYAARRYTREADRGVEDYYWEARGFFPHRSHTEFVPGGMNPTGLVASGQTVSRPRMTRAFERRRNELELYSSGRASMKPEVLVNTVRGRIRYQKTLEGREYLYDRGLSLVEGAVVPQGDFYFVRNPETLPTKIPNDVKAVLANPDRFTKGDEVQMAVWRNEWVREARPGEGPPIEWGDDLSNVRLVPAGNVETLLSDAFYSAPRGNFASVAALLNSVARGSLIYTPYGGTRYVLRNTVQNMILLALTKPTAFKNVAAAVRAAKSDKEYWDSIVVETGGFPAAAGLPEQALRGVKFTQQAEKKVTAGSRKLSSWLSNIADEPWRVAAWMKYAEEYGFKGKARQHELLNSQEPAIVNVREAIGQAVRDDMLDFNSLSPALQEGAARFFFILPFRVAAAKWPLMFAREHTTRAAILALVAAQHKREEGNWGEVMMGGRMVNLGWLSPTMPLQENVGQAVDIARGASDLRLDLYSLGTMLSPTYRDTVQALSRGGKSFESLGKTWVPGMASVMAINAVVRGDTTTEAFVLDYLGATPWKFNKSTKGKAVAWSKDAAELWGAIPKELIEARATKTQYESDVEGKTEHEKTKLAAEYYFKAHPEDEVERADWMERIRTAKTEDLDGWQGYFEKKLGWTDVSNMDSRIEVYNDMLEYLETHPEDKEYEKEWRQDIARASDDKLSGWRGYFKEAKEAAS